jgi:hypothetical protein
MGKSEDKGLHSRMLLSSLADARVYVCGGPEGDQARALTPARCARRVRRCLNVLAGESGSAGSGEEGTEYMFMVESAEPVARSEWSGENLALVMPRAWARERVVRGEYLRVLDGGPDLVCAGDGERV